MSKSVAVYLACHRYISIYSIWITKRVCKIFFWNSKWKEHLSYLFRCTL